MTQCKSADCAAGSGRSFTAYVFEKSSKAQRAQRAQCISLADASVAQPVSPQALAAQKIIAESPSPINTPHIIAASRLAACQTPANSKAGTAVSISVDATAAALEHRLCSDTCTDQAEACGMSDRSCDAHQPFEVSADQAQGKAGHHFGYGKHSCVARCPSLEMQILCSNSNTRSSVSNAATLQVPWYAWDRVHVPTAVVSSASKARIPPSIREHLK